MRDEPVQLDERPGVEQHLEPFAGRHLALVVLRRDTLGAATELGLGPLLLEELELLSHSHKAESRRAWTGQLRLDAQTHRGEQQEGAGNPAPSSLFSSVRLCV